jgi:26S proteasome regulatory subunit T3
MAEVVVDTPVNALPPPKRATFTSIPTVDSLEGVVDGEDEYATLKKLQRHLEYDAKTFV